MNILHLKYAVEIAKTKSISRVAENLYMGQPNLSRAIKELEDNLNITIFNRNSKGITITPEGEEFFRLRSESKLHCLRLCGLFKKYQKGYSYRDIL